jgi:hypothetical protein
MQNMISYAKAVMERAMKVQEVILRAAAKKITWWQAAEIIGISDRQMRQWRERYEAFGFRGLFDAAGKPSSKKVAMATVERVAALRSAPGESVSAYSGRVGTTEDLFSPSSPRCTERAIVLSSR